MWTKRDLQGLVRREVGDYGLVVVSNRQPYIFDMVDGELEYILPPGGLTSAIDPLMQACGGTWIAEGSGRGDRYAVDSSGAVAVPPEDPSYSMRLVWLTDREEQGYYFGMSNEGLWPLCHNAYTEPVFDSRDWNTYKAVNQKFADKVLDEINGRPSVVLIQDYHLALLPRLILEADSNTITGQFWHIPWPNPDVFRICPWQEELLDGLLGNGLLGFHLSNDCSNFVESVARTLNARVDNEYNLVGYRGGTTLVRPFPISVDFEQINDEAQGEDVAQEMQRLNDEWGLGGHIVGLGIDRIDYTKGIPHRLRAVERFLEKYPEYVGKVVFVQAGAASRTTIDAYQQLSEQLEQLIQRINSRFGQGSWKPIIYMPVSLPSVTFMALRRLARFCVVSSLHDGMNLVAKEFVASRCDEDGVLILSPFTGAAQELTQALIVNPYATEDFADAIQNAVTMPLEERAARMRHMRDIVQENNIYKWAARFLIEMMQVQRNAMVPGR